ncbi:MAG TPA: leucyl aminopeptidase [Actinomycetales bacterium]|nr:leucyl aminopeptidase [Actinomycetales bacterium]
MPAPRVRAVSGRLSDAVRRVSGRVDVLAVPITTADDGPLPGLGTADAAAVLGFDLEQTLTLEKPTGKAGEVTRVPWAPRAGSPAVDRVVLIGVGDGSATDVRVAAAALARSQRGQDRLLTTLGTGRRDVSTAFAEGIVLGSYSVPRSGVGQTPPAPLRRVDVVGRVRQEDLDLGLTRADATVLARDLANTPSSTKGPAWLAGRARRSAAEVGLQCRVRDHKELAAEGFGGLLAVGSGASRPPRLVELRHEPTSAKSTAPHVVLVGKGITFDSGDISLKPRDAMIGMKTDMTGAAVVLAVLRACAQLDVGVRVTGLMPLAENAIGAASYRPSDVITHYGGRTVEVRNTDAEGRLVLADSLAYADARLDPDVVVDVATLTGAATRGLGRGHAAMFANDDRLAEAFTRAGESSGEQVWRLPLVEDYRSAIDSDVADLCHIATEKVSAGAVVAALFLREFTGGRRWVHLDIAGPGRSERDNGLVNRGGTGFGARLLLSWLHTLR